MFRSLSTSLVLTGILAIAVGIVAIAWPGVTVLALVIIFAIWAFADSILQFTRASSSDGAGPVAGHILLALVDIAAGVVALAWPGITAYVLTIWIGIWAVVTGGGEFVLAFGSGETAGRRALLSLGGLVSIAFGVVLFSRPSVGAISIAEVFGLFALTYGIVTLVLAANVRQTGATLSDIAG
jgi:uncharacterized membrane protein HdeD (DUF308 family)